MGAVQAYGGGPPDPSGASTVEELCARLRSLRTWAGKSYRGVHRDVVRARTARGVPELPVYNTVYRCFQPGRSRLDVELVVDVARVLLGDDTRAHAWRQACRVVVGEADVAAITYVAGELPDDLAAFTGRHGELAQIAALAGSTAVAIEGMPGIGKTQLAVHAGHELLRRGHYTDLQLSADLRGYDDQRPPADPAAVLDGFLRRLGVPGERIGRLDLRGRVAEYRRLLKRRRTLILLDDAANSEQVRPLLPRTEGSLALITSRRALADLPGVRRLSLDVFTPAEALTMLREAAGDRRVDADPEIAERVAELTGHLPLALAVTAASIRANPSWTLADHLDRLMRHRTRLRLDDAVELAVSLSYRDLRGDERRTFRLLATHPGDDIDDYAAAALAGLDLPTARRHLDELQTANLLRGRAAGRYVFHSLIRVFATDRAHDEEAASARRAALTRLFHHYEYAASLAMDAYAPYEKQRRPVVPPAPTPVPRFADRDAATAWLEAERHNLIAAALHAADSGWPEHTSHQSDILYLYLTTAGLNGDGQTLHTRAARIPDPVMRARGIRNLATVRGHLGRYADAERYYQRALPLVQGDDGDDAQRRAELLLREGLSIALTQLGRYDEALSHHERLQELTHALRDRRAEAGRLCNIGITYEHLGRYDEALDCQRRALAMARELGARTGEVRILDNLGRIDLRYGRYKEAFERHARALAISRQIGERRGIGLGLNNLGVIYARWGRCTEALDHQRQALDIARDLGDLHAESSALTNLGATLIWMGRRREALDHLEQALPVTREGGVVLVECEVLNLIGDALLADAPAAALDKHRQAQARADAIGATYERARSRDGLARAAAALGDEESARAHRREAQRLFTGLGVPAPGLSPA